VLEANVASTLNVLEAVAAEAPNATVLLAGSGEIYGPVATERQPVTEAELPAPQNPYAVSKAACDLLGGFFTDARGVRVIRTRSFNHAGPGQSADYVVSSFARQIASAEHIGAAQVEVVTGSTAPRRDFTDVRDVVRAYWELGDGAAPGSYNVCSGRAVAIADILAGLAHHTGIDVRQRTDPSLVRAHEVMEIRGSHDKLTHATGWEPEIPLEQTLRDTLDWWRKELHA
jgi:GDP-4-dehydro-6-deoxy-D-mannose reductase